MLRGQAGARDPALQLRAGQVEVGIVLAFLGEGEKRYQQKVREGQRGQTDCHSGRTTQVLPLSPLQGRQGPSVTA